MIPISIAEAAILKDKGERVFCKRKGEWVPIDELKFYTDGIVLTPVAQCKLFGAWLEQHGYPNEYLLIGRRVPCSDALLRELRMFKERFEIPEFGDIFV